MQNPTLSERFTDFGLALDYADIPPEVIDVVRINILDSLGVMAASSVIGAGAAGRKIVSQLGGSREATVVGLANKVPAANAVIANGMLVHSLDLDDSHSPSITHPSGIIVTTALAVGEAVAASGQEIIAAAVAGYEMITRIGSVAPGELIKSGFHTTGITGPFATAMVAARLFGLARAQTVAALGLAGSQVSGSMEFLADGSEAKQLYAGWASHSGIIAALLAREGLTGPRTALEGRQGFFNTYLPAKKADLDWSVFDDLGRRWRTLDIVYKAYPACHLTHAIIDSIKHLRRAMPFEPEDVESAMCFVPEWYVDKICEPLATKRQPRSSYDARFSIPYVTATALSLGDVPVGQFTPEAIKDPAILRMAQRVSYEVESFPEFPQAYPGAIEIKLRDGRKMRHDQRFNRRLTHDDLREKFANNVSVLLSPAVAEEVKMRIGRLGEDESGVDAIMATFRSTSAERSRTEPSAAALQ